MIAPREPMGKTSMGAKGSLVLKYYPIFPKRLMTTSREPQGKSTLDCERPSTILFQATCLNNHCSIQPKYNPITNNVALDHLLFYEI